MKKSVLIGVLALLVALGFLLLPRSWLSPATDAPDRGAGESVPPAATKPSTAPATAATPDAPQRVLAGNGDPAPAETPLAAGTGAVLVRVVRQGDRAPVPQTPVAIVPARGDVDARRDARRAVTSADGTARIAGLEPGIVAVRVHGAESQRVPIAAGSTREAIVEVAPGLAVRGRVLHQDGGPAAGASIVLGTSRGADAVATAGADGAFALPDVYRYHRVGAVLAGYAPSLLQSLEPARAIELVLPGPAAVVAGTVVDETGRAVTGARVTVEVERDPTQWVDPRGFQLELAATQDAVTDARGTFRFETEPGPTAITVLAAGFAPHAEVITAAGDAAPLRIELQRGQELRGRVVDQHGAAVADAFVQLGGSSGVLRQTGTDGTFAYHSVRRGRIAVRVEGHDIEPFQGERDDPPADGEWTIAVERRPFFRLRLLDEHGGALAGWRVATTSVPGRSVVSGADGRAGLHARAQDRGRLQLHTPDGGPLACDWPAGIEPEIEAELIVPTAVQPRAVLTGRVFDSDGAPLNGRRIALRDAQGGYLGWHELTDGRFRIGPLAAGDYALEVQRPIIHAIGGQHRVLGLRADERRDLGELRPPAGSQLGFRLVRRDGRPLVDPAVFVFDRDGNDARAPSVDGQLHPFPVGRYRYHMMAEEASWVQGEFEVRAGAPTTVELVLEPAVRRRIRVPVPAPAWGTPTHVHCTLLAPDGSVYDESDFDPREELPFSFAPTVAPGRWRVELLLDDGRRFAGEFTVEDLRPRAEPIEIAVQPGR